MTGQVKARTIKAETRAPAAQGLVSGGNQEEASPPIKVETGHTSIQVSHAIFPLDG